MAKKVFLIRLSRPSFELTVVPPLGIMYLASALRTWGKHQVALYDMKVEGNSLERAVRKIVEFAPDIIGLSLMSYETPVMSEIAQQLKQILPRIPIIVGGPHPSTFPQDVMSDPNIDIAVIGEAEETLCAIVERLEEGRSVDDLEGVVVRVDGKIKINPKVSYIENLDMLPMPSWDLIPIKKYFSLPRMGNIYMKKEYMPIFTSRSCPFQCIYCHKIFGKKFRPRSPESVLEEIQFLYTHYGIKEIMIMDDCFNLNKERALEILSRIASSTMEIYLRFPNAMRADRLDREMLIALKEAGTFHTCYAIETASPRLQKYIKKNLDIDKVFNVIEWTDQLDILTHGFFMIGFPTETREEMLATVNFAVRSKLHTAAIFRVTPFKGTELHRIALESGIALSDDPDSYEVYRTRINLSEVPEAEVNDIQNSFYRHFYLKPRRLLRTISLLPNKSSILPRLSMIFLKRAFR